MTPAARRQSAGVALLVCLATLAVLALIGAAFARLSDLERTASQVHSDEVRAGLVASGGLESAIAHLRQAVRDGQLATIDWTYRGEDVDGDGALDAGEDANGNGTLETTTLPLRQALSPSFALDEDGDGRADLLTLDADGGPGRPVGVSGFLPGTYETLGNSYALQVEDLSGRLFVNQGPVDDPVACADPLDPRNRSAVRMFDGLGAALGTGPDLGRRLVAGRPLGGYLVESNLGAALGAADLALVAPHITLHAWVDRATVASDPSIETRRPPPGSALYSSHRGWEAISPAHLIADPRAPVNVNTAERAVLVALLTGLEARYPIEPMGEGTTDWTPMSAATDAITLAEAGAIADRIVAYRNGTLSRATGSVFAPGPFDSWPEFREFVDRYLLGEPGTGIDTAAEASVLEANFNPNTDLNKFNPNLVLWKPVDKSDLVAFTTEFCFRPTGLFEIGSVGRVTRDGGRLVAEKEVRSVLWIYRMVRHTTQADFEAAGHTKSANGHATVTRDTMARQTVDTYPEPDRHGAWADVDGQLAPATIESVETPSIDRRLAFRASYNGMGPSNTRDWVLPNVYSATNGLDASNPLRQDAAEFNSDHSILAGPASSDPRDSNNPGSVLPDGLYLAGSEVTNWQPYASIAYPGDNMAGADRNHRLVTLLFWVKAPYDLNVTRDNGNQATTHIAGGMSDRGWGSYGGRGGTWSARKYYDFYTQWPEWNQAFDFSLFHKWQENVNGTDWNLVLEYEPTSDGGGDRTGAHRWVLMAHTFGYDAFPHGRLLGQASALQWTRADFIANTYYDRVFKAIRWFVNDDYDSFEFGDPLNTLEQGNWDLDDYRLGYRGVYSMDPLWGVPNWNRSVLLLRTWGRVTIDELRLYDALLCETTDLELTETAGLLDTAEYLAVWQGGRYYNETTPARYESAPLDIDAREVLSIEWTAWHPTRARTTFGNPVASRIELGLVDDAGFHGPYAGDGGQVGVRQVVSGPVRYRVEFSTDRPGEGVLECPFLDDVTIYYIPRTGEEIVSYQEVLHGAR